jgi:HEAT repeat protein
LANSSPSTAVPPNALSWEQALAYLQGSDLSLRYYAAWYLGTTRDSRAVAPLLLALQDDEDRTPDGGYPLRRNAAKALGLIGDPAAFSGLVAALACSDLYVREEAAHALGRLGNLQAVAPLLDLLARHLQQGEDQPLEVMIEALGALGASNCTDRLFPFLQHPSERVQSACGWVLYRFCQDLQYLQTPRRLLEHPNAILRQMAVFDLAESGWLGAAPSLATSEVSISLRLNALKRLFETAQILPTPVKSSDAAAVIFPLLDQII